MCKPPSEHTGSETQSETQSESEETDDIEYLRAKWIFDGAKTLDEVIDKLKNQIEYITQLKESGWELIDEVKDDYGPMQQRRGL